MRLSVLLPLVLTAACAGQPARIAAVPLTVDSRTELLLVEARALEANEQLLRNLRAAGYAIVPHRYVELDSAIMRAPRIFPAPDYVVVQSAPRILVSRSPSSIHWGNYGVRMTWERGAFRLTAEGSQPGSPLPVDTAGVVLSRASEERVFGYFAPDVESFVVVSLRALDRV